MSTYKKLMTVGCAAVLAFGLAACGGGDDDDRTAEAPMVEEQLSAQVAALQIEINALRTQLGLEADDDLGDSVGELQTDLAALRMQAEEAEQAAAAAEAEAARLAAEAAAATAARLYAGIGAAIGDADSRANNERFAAYNAAGTAIEVTIGTGTAQGAAIPLSEDKDATVAANHGWEGKRYADPAGGDSIEAVVYSNVEDPEEGRKFGSAAAVTADGDFEYQLTDGALSIDTTDADVAARVASPQFDQSAGMKTFRLPDPNPGGLTVVNIPGSHHGVDGTYNCGPTNATCTVTVAATGFTLTTGTWTFTPSDANARVMDTPDTEYASYGWWLRKAANDGDFTASAFVDERGTVAPASGLDNLNGTATYMGGAAGKYALASSTGGTNDAGHFTARATLEADFTNNTAATAITGTIDRFIGADGESRDWTVELDGSPITDTGGIGAGAETTWTIGGTDADASGQWAGSLRNNGDDGVPRVATGTFYSEYGPAGRMVGAFGANKQ